MINKTSKRILLLIWSVFLAGLKTISPHPVRHNFSGFNASAQNRRSHNDSFLSQQDDDSIVLYKSASYGTLISLADIRDFENKHSILIDVDIPIEEITWDGFFTHNFKLYSLSEMKPRNFFTENAKYFHNGVEKSLPTVNVFEKETHDDRLVVKKNGDGDIQTIIHTDLVKGSVTEYFPIRPQIFVGRYFETDPIVKEDRNTKRWLRLLPICNRGCSEYNVIELAVAYESTFCAAHGGTSTAADDKIKDIIDKASKKYEEEDICGKLKIAYLEGYCSEELDPYKEYVDTGLSGCGNEGILDGFRNLWLETDRINYSRDAAHLLIGRSLETSSLRGCAYQDTVCGFQSSPEADRGFAMSQGNLDTALSAVNVAHQLGTNLGIEYALPGSPDDIMSNDFTSDSTFSSNSAAQLTEIFARATCITSSPSRSRIANMGNTFLSMVWNLFFPFLDWS